MSIGEHKSKWTAMTCRVPQGSIVAPRLFSLYIASGLLSWGHLISSDYRKFDFTDTI